MKCGCSYMNTMEVQINASNMYKVDTEKNMDMQNKMARKSA